jgi:ribosomal-protein-alanine N-acetyltransferase
MVDGLMAAARWRHSHLDWLDAGDLVGASPFLLTLERGRPAGCLACPPDPPGVAWIRVFAGGWGLPAEEAWDAMWPLARGAAMKLGAHIAAALTAEPWMAALLTGSGFAVANQVVFLEHRGRGGEPALPAGVRLRDYRPSDLAQVLAVDQRAFEGPWLYSRSVLAAALEQAASVTVLEVEGVIAGYQLSTASALGAHLARLAVDPVLQGRGYGRALVEGLVYEFGLRGFDRVSVNTQSDNAASLRLYRRLGFRDTGQSYPVYTLSLQGGPADPDRRGAL